MKKLFILLFVVFMISGCTKILEKQTNKEYYIQDGKVMYYCMEFLNLCISGEVEGIDISTFEILENKKYFAKDKDNIYYRGKIVKGADPKSFEVLVGGGYAKDKQYIFYLMGKKVIIVEGADPETFEVLEPYYSRDKNNVFWGAKTIEGADSSSFEILQNNGSRPYAKDKNFVYFYDKKISKADPGSFELIYNEDSYSNNKDVYSKDKNNVYFADSNEGKVTVIKRADPKTFLPLKNMYAKDNDNVYYYGKILEGADPESFFIFDVSYDCAKDENHVFVRDKIEKGVSPVNFQPW